MAIGDILGPAAGVLGQQLQPQQLFQTVQAIEGFSQRQARQRRFRDGVAEFNRKLVRNKEFSAVAKSFLKKNPGALSSPDRFEIFNADLEVHRTNLNGIAQLSAEGVMEEDLANRFKAYSATNPDAAARDLLTYAKGRESQSIAQARQQDLRKSRAEATEAIGTALRQLGPGETGFDVIPDIASRFPDVGQDFISRKISEFQLQEAKAGNLAEIEAARTRAATGFETGQVRAAAGEERAGARAARQEAAFEQAQATLEQREKDEPVAAQAVEKRLKAGMTIRELIRDVKTDNTLSFDQKLLTISLAGARVAAGAGGGGRAPKVVNRQAERRIIKNVKLIRDIEPTISALIKNKLITEEERPIAREFMRQRVEDLKAGAAIKTESMLMDEALTTIKQELEIPDEATLKQVKSSIDTLFKDNPSLTEKRLGFSAGELKIGAAQREVLIGKSFAEQRTIEGTSNVALTIAVRDKGLIDNIGGRQILSSSGEIGNEFIISAKDPVTVDFNKLIGVSQRSVADFGPDGLGTVLHIQGTPVVFIGNRTFLASKTTVDENKVPLYTLGEELNSIQFEDFAFGVVGGITKKGSPLQGIKKLQREFQGPLIKLAKASGAFKQPFIDAAAPLGFLLSETKQWNEAFQSIDEPSETNRQLAAESYAKLLKFSTRLDSIRFNLTSRFGRGTLGRNAEILPE